MYAYAHARDTKNINVLSIADYRNELSVQTPSSSGLITAMGEVFKNMKRPAPFIFVWKAEKLIPETLFTTLKRGEEFSLDLRILEIDEKGNSRSSFHFDFAQCSLIKTRILSGRRVKVEATYNYFRKSPD